MPLQPGNLAYSIGYFALTFVVGATATGTGGSEMSDRCLNNLYIIAKGCLAQMLSLLPRLVNLQIFLYYKGQLLNMAFNHIGHLDLYLGSAHII